MTADEDGLQPCGRFEWERILRRAVFPMRIKLVALTLATYADADGTRVRPGVDVLAAVTGMGASTVRRILSALREFGLIELVSRGGGRAGRGRAAEYRLTLPPNVDVLVMLPPSEVSPLSMESAQSRDSPLAQESAQSGQETYSPLAIGSAQSESPESIDRSENTVTEGLTARSDRLTARSSERLPEQEHQPPKSDQPFGPDPTQPDTARDTTEPIQLRPRKCPHGLPAHRRDDGTPTCAACRRGLPAKDAQEAS